MNFGISKEIFEELSWKNKEANPETTIFNIRTALHKIGILCKETWRNPIHGFYTVSLRIIGTIYLANGKGSSVIAALASAYAELVERLQNLAVFNFEDFKYCKDTDEYNFTIFPDENKFYDSSNLLNNHNSWYRSLKLDNPELFFDKLKLAEGGNYVTAIPFYNIENKHKEYIPYILIREYYLTNGMSAGNTYEEAAVQGVCEVVERFVHKKILTDKIVLPLIPNMFLNKQNKQLLANLNAVNDLVVEVFDAYECYGFPVIVAIASNYKKDIFFMRVGCFPDLNIAVERTLTELMQGKSLKNRSWLLPLNQGNYIKPHEIEKHFVSGISPLPAKILMYGQKKSACKNWSKTRKKNINYLQEFIKTFKEKKLSILIRRIGWLGFPTVHVIIPGMSEILQDVNYSIENFINFSHFSRLLRNVSDIQLAELHAVLNYITPLSKTFGEACALKFTKESPFTQYSSKQAAFMIALKLHKNEEAVKIALNMLSDLDNKKSEVYMLLEILISLIQKQETVNQIKYWDRKIYEEAKSIIENSNGILNSLPTVDCANCKNCIHYSHCYTSRSKKLLSILRPAIDTYFRGNKKNVRESL